MKLQTIMPKLVFISFIPIMLIVSGCSSVGNQKGGSTGAEVSLNSKNYSLICGGATGKSYGFRLLGIIPITSPTYSTAKHDLYESTGQPLTGKAIALINQTEDRSSLYLILFSIPRLTLTADVIEFTGESKAVPVTPAAPSVVPPTATPTTMPVVVAPEVKANAEAKNQ